MASPTREPAANRTDFLVRPATPQDKPAIMAILQAWRKEATAIRNENRSTFSQLRETRADLGKDFHNPEHAGLRKQYKQQRNLAAHVATTTEICGALHTDLRQGTANLADYRLLYHNGELTGIMVASAGKVDDIVADPRNLRPDNPKPVQGIANALLTEAIREHEQKTNWATPLVLDAGSNKVKSIYHRYFFDTVRKNGEVIERPPSEKDEQGQSIKRDYHHSTRMQLTKEGAERFLRGERRPKPGPAITVNLPELAPDAPVERIAAGTDPEAPTKQDPRKHPATGQGGQPGPGIRNQ